MFDTLLFTLLILLWPLCLALIGLILLQGGAGDLSSAFGGGGQLDSTLGVGAGRKMSKLTGWLCFAFLVSVAILAIPHGTVGGLTKKTLGGAATEDAPAVMGPPAGSEGTQMPATDLPAGGIPVEGVPPGPEQAPTEHAPAAVPPPEAQAPVAPPVQPEGMVPIEAAPVGAAPEAAAPIAPAPAEAGQVTEERKSAVTVE